MFYKNIYYVDKWNSDSLVSIWKLFQKFKFKVSGWTLPNDFIMEKMKNCN